MKMFTAAVVGVLMSLLEVGAADTTFSKWTFVVDVCGVSYEQTDRVVLLQDCDQFAVAVGNGAKDFVVEEIVGENQYRKVVSDFDRGLGDRPALAWRMDGMTRPLQVRSFRVVPQAVAQERDDSRRASKVSLKEENGRIVVGTKHFEVAHLQKGKGGQPVSVLERKSGKTESGLFLNDRLHHKDVGSFVIGNDTNATARVVHAGPLMVVVEANTHYVGGGRPSPDGLRAVYRYTYLADSPTVEVTATMTRDASKQIEWSELHFLELSAKHDRFRQMVLGENGRIVQVGGKNDQPKSHHATDWAMMSGDGLAVGVGGGPVICYDNATGSFFRYVSRGGRPLTRTDPGCCFSGALGFGPGVEQFASPAEAAKWYRQHLGGNRNPRMRVHGGEEYPHPMLANRSLYPPGHDRSTQFEPILFRNASEDPSVDLYFDPDNYACLGMDFRALGMQFFREREGCPGLWRLVFRNGVNGEEIIIDNKTVHAQSIPSRVRTSSTRANDNNSLQLKWEGINLANEVGVVDVICEVDCLEDAFAFSIKLVNRSKTWGLARTDYPLLGEVIPPGSGKTLVPFAGNWGQRLVSNNRQPFYAPYPSAAAPLPFMAFSLGAAGVYLGCHDPGASLKYLRLNEFNDVCFEIPSENAGVPGSAGTPKYPIVVGVFEDSWWNAAARYRKWAMKQPWTAKGPIAKRADYPKRLSENGFWLLVSGFGPAVEKTVDRMLERTKGEIPFGIHWYNWHAIPFDNSYPEYFPTKPGFAESVKRMTAKNVLVMPYINGRLWDRDIPSFKPACPFASKQPNGEPYFETYGSGRWLAAMCPTTKFWKDRVADISTRLVEECGVNAIYYDQIGAARPRPCFDPSHGHPLGGGPHWVDGYRDLLTPIKARLKGTVLTTENTADPYMDNLDAYLTWSADTDTDVPALPAIYSGYTAWFASAGNNQDTAAAFRAYVLRDTLWGCQPGWMSDWILDEAHKEHCEALLACGRLRKQYREFLSEGRLVGEVKNELHLPPVSMVWHCRRTQEVSIDPVMAVVWENLSGKRLTFVANLSDKPCKFAGSGSKEKRIECTLNPGEVKTFEQ